MKRGNGAELLDSYVKLNFMTVRGELAAGVTASILALVRIKVLPYYGPGIDGLIAVIVAVCVMRCIKKLFYTTTYAEGAAVYNMLPVDYGDAVVIKVVVATFCTFLPLVSLAAMANAGASLSSDDGGAFILLPEGAKTTATAVVVITVMLYYLCQTFNNMALAFWGITLYNTAPQSSRTFLRKGAAVVLVYAVCYAPELIAALLQRAGLGTPGAEVVYAAAAAVKLAIGVAACMATRTRLEKKYFLD